MNVENLLNREVENLGSKLSGIYRLETKSVQVWWHIILLHQVKNGV